MIRLVKMEFEEKYIITFLEYFESIKEKVRAQEGCTHLELLQDKHKKNVFFTYSIWEDEKYLNQYRDSAFFKEVWSFTKKHFNAKPLAWSVEQMHVLE